ncbi:hypothetical protein OGAPHI_000682 [Ogataea philodendri]|uniref:Uncharacterized protein n=1 Tax=Ogataea philodendri TaxID=1378263 RepID=A0A9P8TAC6_9ASCO|nr:uncharacterized protein OGAPHI_000682 [Ogataea philodendri]KAH3670971.1 hypothetical protein OGAPHI_000682 [Ogataea philodendri]
MEIVIPEGEYEGDLFANHKGHAVFEAVTELCRLGFGFAEILAQSQCEVAFLEGVFQTLKLPVKLRRQTRPFHTSAWVDRLVIDVSESEEEEETEDTHTAVRRKLNSANRTALVLNESIRKLDYQLRAKKAELDRTLKEIEDLENTLETMQTPGTGP